MDGTESYNEYGGYDDYDPGMSDTTMPEGYISGDKRTSPHDEEPDNPVPIASSPRDRGRRDEIDIAGDGFTLPEEYVSPHTTGYGEVPLIPVHTDVRRVSVHPLAIVEAPPGVEESRWRILDADGIFTRSYDPYEVGEEPEPYAVIEEPAGPPETVTAVSPGGVGGGDGRGREEEEDYDPTEMPFLDHLEELRWSLLKSIFSIAIGMLVSWFITDYFFKTFTILAKKAELPLVTTKVLETLIMKIQMALVMGVVLTLPFVFYFLWSFVSPGLYKREKKWILPLVIAATACFFIGVAVAYFFVIPMVLLFLKNFIPPDIMPMITIGNFIGTILKFIILFGVIFQMPLISFVLAKIGIIKYTLMTKYRKYAIVGIFVIGAVLTPPDPLTQILMAIPLLLLYEISILVARIAGRNTLL